MILCPHSLQGAQHPAGPEAVWLHLLHRDWCASGLQQHAQLAPAWQPVCQSSCVCRTVKLAANAHSSVDRKCEQVG